MLPPASNPTLTDRKPQQLARCTASWSVHSRGGGGAAMCRSRDTLFASKRPRPQLLGWDWSVAIDCGGWARQHKAHTRDDTSRGGGWIGERGVVAYSITDIGSGHRDAQLGTDFVLFFYFSAYSLERATAAGVPTSTSAAQDSSLCGTAAKSAQGSTGTGAGATTGPTGQTPTPQT